MTTYRLTNLQRRFVKALLLEPGQRSGQLREKVNQSGWNPKVTTRGATRSLGGLRELGIVQVSIGEAYEDWKYELTTRGRGVAVELAAA